MDGFSFVVLAARLGGFDVLVREFHVGTSSSDLILQKRCPRRRCFQCGSVMRSPFLVAGKRWTFYITGLISASNALTDLTIRIRTVYFGVLNYAKQIGIVFTAPT